MRYRSCAEWPPDVYTGFDGSHVSTDEHETHVEAHAVTVLIRRHGFGGNGTKKPIRTWVEEIPEPPKDDTP